MFSYRQLMQAQQDAWPGSVYLTPLMVIDWAHRCGDNDKQMRRYGSINMAFSLPRVLFYLTTAGHIGARYGLDGHEYLSGFNDKAVELRGLQLIDSDSYAI